MSSDYKMKAYNAYREYVSSEDTTLSEERWTEIWSVIQHYVKAVIKGKDYNCSDFDLDDHLSEVQMKLWSQLSAKTVPHDTPSLWVGSIKVVTQRFLIDCYRRDQTETKSRETYGDQQNAVHEQDLNNKLWASHIVGWHKDLIAVKMAERSRFELVDYDLCRNYVELESRDADAQAMIDMIAETEYWDPGFLYRYMTILFRWVYYDVNYGPDSLVA